MDVLKAGDTILPSPVSMTLNNEIIWDSDTGRTLDGTMVGDVVAEKNTLDISWGYLTDSDIQNIRDCLIAGFFPITVFPGNASEITIEAYRGTLSAVFAGTFGGDNWYSSASTKIVEV